MHTRNCQMCGADDLAPIIDLGHHPLADTFLPSHHLNQSETRYPLRVLLCKQCGYATLSHVVSQEERYQGVDYSYTASNSPVSISHFTDMAKDIGGAVEINAGDLVVDIGSSDGTLLRSFREQSGCRIQGVEPAKNIAESAERNGIPTINDFFTSSTVSRIVSNGKAQVITATNVYNHITDMNAFMENILAALTNDGMFIFETPSLLDLIRRTAFDTIYLEHVSYFGVKPLARFYKKFGLYIHKIELNDYMGGSMRVYVSKMPADSHVADAFIRMEETAGSYDPATYASFMNRVHAFKFDLCRELYAIKARGGKIIGIGAATKGNTLLNYCKIDGSILEFITDNSPLKIGKYTPGSHIPIKSDADIHSGVTHALILPWNIGDFLKEKLKHLKLDFIVPSMGR